MIPLAERVPTEEAPGPEPPRLIIHNDRAREELACARPAETTIVETAEGCATSACWRNDDDGW